MPPRSPGGAARSPSEALRRIASLSSVRRFFEPLMRPAYGGWQLAGPIALEWIATVLIALIIIASMLLACLV